MTATTAVPVARPVQRSPWLVVAAIVTVVSLAAGAAWAYWTASSIAGSNGASAATSVNQGATPTANVSGGSVTVSWAATTLTSGQAVSGYVIKRYNASDVLQTILSSCTGTIAALSCVEISVPTGSWKYSVTPVFATNWQGIESAKSTLVVVDTTAPTNTITVTDAAGAASRTGTTIYYRGAVAGSFTLTNAVADAGSGPASSQTAALGGTSTGWTHSPSTVSTPAGGPYVSNTFSWLAGTATSPTEVVTGRDVAANTAAASFTFTNDSSAPSAGSITYPDGYTAGRSITVTFTPGTDAGSGIDLTNGRLKRSVATLTNGVCGSYGTTNAYVVAPTSPYVDTNVSAGYCYTYQYVAYDNVGNTYFNGSPNVAMVDYAAAVDATAGLLSWWRFGETAITSSDNFTDTTGTVLSSHTSQDGSTWTKLAADTTTVVLTNANRIRGNGTGNTLYYTDETPPSADYLVEADIYVIGPVGGDYAGVVGRVNPAGTGTGTFYTARYRYTTGEWELSKMVNGVGLTSLGTYTQSLTTGSTYRVGLEMIGSSIRLLVDGVERVSGTDSAITAAGRAGVRFVATTTPTNTTGLHIDNFDVSPIAIDSKGTNEGDYHRGVALGASGIAAGNTAATFDGVNDSMQVPVITTALPLGATARTVEVWFKTPGVAAGMARQTLFSYGTNADTQAFGAWLEKEADATGVRIKAWGGGASDRVLNWTNNFYDNAWHHFVLTYDGTSTKMYVDGILGTGTTTATRNTVSGAYGFGSGAMTDPTGLSTTSYFNGSLDELAFYNTAFTQTTVTNHYELGSAPVQDIAGPTGGSVSASGLVGTGSLYSTSTTLNVVFAPGTDPSGIRPTGASLRRATATLTSTAGANGVCGSYSAYVQVASDPISPWTDTVTDQACYRYQYYVDDNWGNTRIYTSGDIKVDTTAPSAPTYTVSGLTNTYWSGAAPTVVYYRSGASSGSFTMTASATDAASGVSAYTFPALGTGWTSTPGALGVNTYSWSAANAAAGTSNITATNNATGTSANSPFTLTQDNTAPSAGTVTYTGGSQTATTVSVAYTTGTDGGSGIGTRLLQRASATLTGITCGTYTAFATITGGTNPGASPVVDTVTAGSCYMYQYVVNDQVGNQHIATSANEVKVVQPYAATVSGTSGLVNYFRLGEDLSSSDTFTDTATTVLSSHTPNVGTSWTRWVNDTITGVITNANALRKTNASGGVGYYTGVAPVSPDYLVEADVVVKSIITSDTIGVVGRWRTTQVGGVGTNYVARYNTTTAAWELQRNVNGVSTLLGSYAQALTAGTTYRVGLDMNGTTIRLLVDGVQRLSVTDADPNLNVAGRAGLRLGTSTDTATQSDTTGLHLDNFYVTPALVDSFGTNNGDYFNGTLLGVAGALNGDSNTAVTFDGVNDYASVTRTIQADFSIEYWFKSTQVFGTTCAQWWQGARLVDAETAGTAADFGTSLCQGKVIAGVGGGAGGGDVHVVSAAGYNDGNWHHVVMTRENTSKVFELYIDGGLIGSGVGGTAADLDASALIYMGRGGAGNNPFAGSLDEVALYSVVLTAAQVAAHYAAR